MEREEIIIGKGIKLENKLVHIQSRELGCQKNFKVSCLKSGETVCSNCGSPVQIAESTPTG